MTFDVWCDEEYRLIEKRRNLAVVTLIKLILTMPRNAGSRVVYFFKIKLILKQSDC